MTDTRLDSLIQQMRSGVIDRRTFFVRAAAMGLGASALMHLPVAVAQDASGDDVELIPENIGTEGASHSTDTSKGTINLYSSWPLSGASEQLGGDMVVSVQLAIEAWGGAAGGFAINYEGLDDGLAANNGSWDAAKEAENASMVVNDEDAVAYIGTYNSGAAEASIPITNAAGLAQIAPANTAVQLTKESPSNPEGYPEVLYEATGKRNYMRVCPADDFQGAAGAAYAYNELGCRKIYIIHDNQTYGKGIAEVVQQTFEALGGEVVGFEAFDPNAPEYQAFMTKVASQAPDIVYMGAIVNLNAPKLLQDLRDQLSADDCAFMGPDGLMNQAFVDGSGEASEGAYITFGGLPPLELKGAGAAWAKQMQDRVGHLPDAYSVYAFECAAVVLQAIDQVGEKDRAKVLDEMFQTHDFRGLVGTWSFTETGDPDTATMSLNQVRDGQIDFVTTIAPPEV
ncbi:MAG TPA: branched-chain amino acid ABC transporter substrate-binding protein [Thermomicrobiales bacterium]|nr:branched-chain amino acid ABC transporter substrate-binding protein [Thermomicrobiales bacterium]